MNLVVKLVGTNLTVTPDSDGVSPGSNGVTLTWTRDTTGAAFQFTANSVTGLPNPPFSTPVYNSSNNTVTVTDRPASSSPTGVYSYGLTVNAGGNTITAGGNPSIRNR
jgi:hypothetical protein